jgi:hypothetical protein
MALIEMQAGRSSAAQSLREKAAAVMPREAEARALLETARALGDGY